MYISDFFRLDVDLSSISFSFNSMSLGAEKNEVYPEATFKCGKKSQIMQYRTCRKWRIVRSCAMEFLELCGKCAVNLIELCDYYVVNHGIVQKICGT
jgi:hypothetical protein